MKTKRITLAIALTLLAGLLCASVVYAAGDTEIGSRIFKRADQKVSSEAWDALTDAQKNELYAAKEAVDAAQKALYDKAAEYGLVDEETAEAMKQSTDETTASMRENDQPPLFDFRFKMDVSEMRQPLTDEELEAMRTQMEERLQQAVEEGKLTQEEADNMLERMNGMGNMDMNGHGGFRFDFKMPEGSGDATNVKGTSVKGL